MANTLIVAHRGYSCKYPECTELAYVKAIELGVDYIEMDIMRTKDGRFVVFHAKDLREVSEAQGKIHDYTYEELQKINITGGLKPRNEFNRIPCLERILEISRTADVRICAELKDLEHRAIPGYENLVMPIFEKYQVTNKLVVNTKNLLFIKACRQKYPYVPIAIDLMAGKSIDMDMESYLYTVLGLGVQIVQYKYEQMTKDITRELRCRGLSVWAWTINDPEEMLDVIDMGADAILTDDPLTLKTLIGKEYGGTGI